jgi:hypothetical protein
MLGLFADFSSGGMVQFCLVVALPMPVGRYGTDYHQPKPHAFLLQRSHHKEHGDGEQRHDGSTQLEQRYGSKALKHLM